MQIDGISAIAIILIASFAIDRIVTGLLFLLSFLHPWAQRFPEPVTRDGAERIDAERKQKLVYFAFAGVLAVFLGWYGNLRIFHASGFDVPGWIDAIVTGLLLMGGADRVAALLNIGGGGGESKSSQQPIQITGKITLEQPPNKKSPN
jgi:hypothetical protein